MRIVARSLPPKALGVQLTDALPGRSCFESRPFLPVRARYELRPIVIGCRGVLRPDDAT